MEPTTNTPSPQKRGSLTGGAASAEALASSKSVTGKTRSGGTAGLQQFFTPAPIAEFIASVLDPDGRMFTLDLTAGDGSLLAPYPHIRRVGVEMDADQIAAAKEAGQGYQSLHGDVQHLYPLLRVSGVRFSRVVLNPPFGLTWQQASVNGGKPCSSTRATLEMGLGLLGTNGQGAIITGAARLEAEILSQPELAKSVYAVVQIPGAFPGVSLPTAVAFFGTGDGRKGSELFTGTAESADALPALREHVLAAQRKAFWIVSSRDTLTATEVTDALRDIGREHARRLSQRQGTAAADVTLSGRQIRVHLSTLSGQQIIAERGADVWQQVSRLDKQGISYLALNRREWKALDELAQAGLLVLDAAARTKIEAMLARADALACPVYPIKPQQRLGYLADTDALPCTLSDPAKGFTAGESYPVTTQSRIAVSERKEVKEVETAQGRDVRELVWSRRAKVLDVCLTPGRLFPGVTLSEKKSDIEYLLSHFALPDPGDLATRFPAEMENRRDTLRQIETDVLGPQGRLDTSERNGGRPFGLKEYQREDIARLLMKGGGVLAWDMGLGKTLGAMTFAEALARRGETSGNVLFIVPQDLIPQWQAEAQKFFGRDLVRLHTRAQAHAAAKAIATERRAEKANRRLLAQDADAGDPFYDRRDAGQWYITHLEALSQVGTQAKALPGTVAGGRGERLLPMANVKTVTKKVFVPGGWEGGRYRDNAMQTQTVQLTTEDLCPRCWTQEKRTTDTGGGWNGKCCAVCGYAHKALDLKPMAHELTTAFRDGLVIVDEGTKIKGDSLQSFAVRGLRARRRLLLSGTPQKNYVIDLFHLMGWSLGYSSPRFPFAHSAAQKFRDDFCVTETLRGEKGRVKTLPEVTNLSVLWRMVTGAIVRRRKEDAGEPIVSRTFVPVTVPFGTAQRTQYNQWLNRFDSWYCAMNPDANPAMVEMNSAILGQLHKLEYATTLPTADPDADYWGANVSDWTPKTLKVAELAAFHAARGEKVLVGSDVMLTGRFVTNALNAKGIPAAHILEETKSGKIATKGPAARAGATAAFRTGDTRVLCAGVQSINLGHNMDHASVVILDGLPWDFATLDQFLARVHRLSSTRPVTVYVVMTEASLDERKWKLLMSKGASADLVLDGELSDRDEKPIDKQAIIRDLQRRGVAAASTVSEGECERLWQAAQFEMRPLGACWTDAPADPKPAGPKPEQATPAASQGALAFTFAPILPKRVRNAPAIGSMFDTQAQQGLLFAL